MNFNEKLKELRIQNDLKLQDIADYLGVSKPTVSRFETGEREPSFENLIKLADFYKVSTDYLLGRSNCDLSGEKLEVLKLSKKVKSIQEQLDELQNELVSKLK
jgi:transcriptional regulator with XRE-family HTH domain